MQIRKLAAGDRLLDYRILEKIGEGGFGEVFRAEHEVLGRIVAIKVPRDLEALSALRLEGVIQATLDHPAIVRTLEISISHDPPYVVLEHVDGMSLAEAIKKEGPLHWKRASRILVEAGRALKHAHERGVIHGDVKPGNVLVEPGETGRVRLTDFGLGRVFEGPRGNVQISRSLELATSGAEVQGTLRYLAPEVTRGEPADERSDIYSWSVLLFEAITGKLPEGREVPSDLTKGCPREIDEVFEACFQRRERRPRSLDTSIAALERLLANGPRPKNAATDEDGRASRAIPFRAHDGKDLVSPLGGVELRSQNATDRLNTLRNERSGAPTPDALHALRMLGETKNKGALPAMPGDGEALRGAPAPVPALPAGARAEDALAAAFTVPAPPRATELSPPPEVDLGAATRRARSDPAFQAWRDRFIENVKTRFSVRPVGAGVVAGEGFDLGVGITTEGDPHHRIYTAVVPYVDLEVARRFVKASKQVFEREKGVWEKEVTFCLLAREVQEETAVLSTLRAFSTGWWRRRRTVLFDLAKNRMHAAELGCDPRGNPLKRIYFDAVADAAKQTAAPVMAGACRARRECIRGGLMGIGLSLVATASLVTGVICLDRAAHHRFLRHHPEHQLQHVQQVRLDVPDGSSMRALGTPEAPRLPDPLVAPHALHAVPLPQVAPEPPKAQVAPAAPQATPAVPELPRTIEKAPAPEAAPATPAPQAPEAKPAEKAPEAPKAPETPPAPEAKPRYL
jgi:serine/threonine protein kinase